MQRTLRQAQRSSTVTRRSSVLVKVNAPTPEEEDKVRQDVLFGNQRRTQSYSSNFRSRRRRCLQWIVFHAPFAWSASTPSSQANIAATVL